MSTSMGIASVFVLSSLMLSPMAMAEESQGFIAQKAAHDAAFEKNQAHRIAAAKDAEEARQAKTEQVQDAVTKDS